MGPARFKPSWAAWNELEAKRGPRRISSSQRERQLIGIRCQEMERGRRTQQHAGTTVRSRQSVSGEREPAGGDEAAELGVESERVVRGSSPGTTLWYARPERSGFWTLWHNPQNRKKAAGKSWPEARA